MSRPVLRGTVDPVRDGRGDARLIVLGPSLGTTTALWEQTAATLALRHRVLRFDLPGHGAAPPSRAAFEVADVADAVIELVDSIGGGSFHYAGISFGGAVGLELALRHPGRLDSLAVICSAAKIGAAEGWVDRAAEVRASGTASTVASSASRWFAPGFLEREAALGSQALSALLEVDDESYALCCEALARFDVTSRVPSITTRSLCVSGEHDLPTPTAQLAELAAAIPGALHVTMSGVAHLPALERPEVLAELVLEHVEERVEPPGAAHSHSELDRAAVGMGIRRAVLGDAHVDAAIASTTADTADFQDFITRYAWGEVWARPGLDRRSRSLLTVAALITAGHEAELAMHVRAALTNGLTREELAEAVLHVAIYAGVPAANTASRVLRETLAGLDAAASAHSLGAATTDDSTTSDHTTGDSTRYGSSTGDSPRYDSAPDDSTPRREHDERTAHG